MSKTALTIFLVVFAVLVGLAAWQFLLLRKAHSTFENYYAFRGCTELLERTDTSGICRTNTNQTIKIVKFDNKWYLEGDLPWGCVGKICFGI